MECAMYCESMVTSRTRNSFFRHQGARMNRSQTYHQDLQKIIPFCFHNSRCLRWRRMAAPLAAPTTASLAPLPGFACPWVHCCMYPCRHSPTPFQMAFLHHNASSAWRLVPHLRANTPSAHSTRKYDATQALWRVLAQRPLEWSSMQKVFIYEHSNRRNRRERSPQAGRFRGAGKCTRLLATEAKARCAFQTAGLAEGGLMGRGCCSLSRSLFATG